MFTVFLVDDDVRVVKALSRLLRGRGYTVEAYTSPQQFLDEHDGLSPGCAVLDLAMPGFDGLELQQALAERGLTRPIIFLTGNGDIPTTVRAMRAGAVDFLTKPASVSELVAAIERAQASDLAYRQTQSELSALESRIATLTPREREVLAHVVAGKLNKQIAHELGTVEKTIKFHRGSLMRKLGVRMVADLVRLADKVGIGK